MLTRESILEKQGFYMCKSSRELYIDPDDLKKELKNYKQTNVISDELGVIFLKIAKRFATKSCFSGYSYKDEFISDAIYRMVEQIGKVRTNKGSNAFGYLTQICYNCFIGKIAKEKKYTKLKENLTTDVLDDVENEENISFKKMKKEIFDQAEETPLIVDDTFKKKRRGTIFFKKKKEKDEKNKSIKKTEKSKLNTIIARNAVKNYINKFLNHIKKNPINNEITLSNDVSNDSRKLIQIEYKKQIEKIQTCFLKDRRRNKSNDDRSKT